MRDQVGKYLAEGVAVGWEKNDPMASIERDLNVGVSRLSVQAQALEGTGGTTSYQTVNFNQPVESPDQVARTMRLQQRYGLAVRTCKAAQGVGTRPCSKLHWTWAHRPLQAIL